LHAGIQQDDVENEGCDGKDNQRLMIPFPLRRCANEQNETENRNVKAGNVATVHLRTVVVMRDLRRLLLILWLALDRPFERLLQKSEHD